MTTRKGFADGGESFAALEPRRTFLDNPLAPDIFIDGAAGFTVNNGVLRIALASGRVNHTTSSGPVQQVQVCRVVMPIADARDLAVGIFEFLKARQLDPSAPVEMKPN